MTTLTEQLRREAAATEELHPDDSEISVMREAADLIDALLPALREARETIRALHGSIAWDIYEKNAPEMKRLDAALSKATAA